MSILAVSQHKSIIWTTKSEEKQGVLSLQVLVLHVYWHSCFERNYFSDTDSFLILCVLLNLFFVAINATAALRRNLLGIHTFVAAHKLIVELPLANISKIIPWSDKRERAVQPLWPHWPHWPLWPLQPARSSQSCFCLLSGWLECGGLFLVGNFI